MWAKRVRNKLVVWKVLRVYHDTIIYSYSDEDKNVEWLVGVHFGWRNSLTYLVRKMPT